MVSRKKRKKKALKFQLHRWWVELKGGNLRRGQKEDSVTGLHAFSITIIFHADLLPRLVISNVKGSFDEEGRFTLEPRILWEIFGQLLGIGAQKVYLDNPQLVGELNQVLLLDEVLAEPEWGGVELKKRFEPDYLARLPDLVEGSTQFFETWCFVLAFYLVWQIELFISTEYEDVWERA